MGLGLTGVGRIPDVGVGLSLGIRMVVGLVIVGDGDHQFGVV